MKNLGKVLFSLIVLAVVFASCEKDTIIEEAINEEMQLKSAEVDAYLNEVIDFEYITDGKYLAAGKDNSGAYAFYFGNHKNWERLSNSKTTQNIWGQFLDVAFNFDAESGVKKMVYAYVYQNEWVVTNGGTVANNGTPTFGKGKNVFRYEVKEKNPETGNWEKNGETEVMTEFLDLDWSPLHKGYVISGKTETGRVVSFFSSTGGQGTWKYISSGANEAWGTFIASEFGTTSAGWKGIYCYNFSRDGYVVTNGIYGNKKGPRFFRGKAYVGPAGDRLVSVVTFDYVPSAQYFVITGESENGGLATYYGNHKAWTKLEDKYAPKNNSWGPYKEVAFDNDADQDGKFKLLYLFDRESKGIINSNGGYEFYGKPRHSNGGAPVK